MKLGAFSVSLAVRDLAASQVFYEKLGFSAAGGEAEHGYLIMRNEDAVIGLFQGMFERNILTFNPGWDQAAQPVAGFADVRSLQAELQAAGLSFAQQADPEGTGPASFMVIDPDGNPVLVDQHI
ncbi:VOC family protein [Marinovum sp. SP66]|uniref:VOC family protein n=1 Tax=Marinovum TaxID=367771 RepID=UPI00237BF0EB|nr:MULTISPECIES: VOC family protein [unclassified Marinovum]MDD9739049.1 VOC family protein [Marinovum sp. SP66]MDD9744169.1 VOC family protein [Marinovum sp. PR37]